MSSEMIVSLTLLGVLAVLASHALHSRKRGLSVASATSRRVPPVAARLWDRAPPSRHAADQRSDNTRCLLETAPLPKAEAEELLDWLEANGFTHLQVTYLPERGFVVKHVRAEEARQDAKGQAEEGTGHRIREGLVYRAPDGRCYLAKQYDKGWLFEPESPSPPVAVTSLCADMDIRACQSLLAEADGRLFRTRVVHLDRKTGPPPLPLGEWSFVASIRFSREDTGWTLADLTEEANRLP